MPKIELPVALLDSKEREIVWKFIAGLFDDLPTNPPDGLSNGVPRIWFVERDTDGAVRLYGGNEGAVLTRKIEPAGHIWFYVWAKQPIERAVLRIVEGFAEPLDRPGCEGYYMAGRLTCFTAALDALPRLGFTKATTE